MGWIDNIKLWSGVLFDQSSSETRSRSAPMKIVCGVVNPRNGDS